MNESFLLQMKSCSLSRAQHVGPGCSFYELMEMGPKRTFLMKFCHSLCYLCLPQHALAIEYGLGVILATSTVRKMQLRGSRGNQRLQGILIAIPLGKSCVKM